MADKCTVTVPLGIITYPGDQVLYQDKVWTVTDFFPNGIGTDDWLELENSQGEKTSTWASCVTHAPK